MIFKKMMLAGSVASAAIFGSPMAFHGSARDAEILPQTSSQA